MKVALTLQCLLCSLLLFGVFGCKPHSHKPAIKYSKPISASKEAHYREKRAETKQAPPLLKKPEKMAAVSKKIEKDNRPPRVNVEGLVGAGSKTIVHLLGQPDFSRRDPPAWYWQYKLKKCTLDFFLYPDRSNKKSYRVSHFQSRGKQNIESCFAAAAERLKYSPPS